ncbi:MAG: cytochrome C biogenesis protein [Nitrosopumilales archaeon CG15_BIG_FIL_POST_REV_8_21_14_020_33_23]|nr:MAG: cytochrome C biogenesis protein [Nitrosopumilales archaeon CG15_BIG_FIL_POST_REV_8_21_14_020_33_23]PIY88099.1 MAG: cytochrome C biogenesis protein [Nitrosopumilales archaeon CG_4_10_14_0_8_um_filter_34_8]
MSSQIAMKKSLILVLFVLFSLIFVGGVFAATNEIAIGAGNEISYPSWLVIAYLAGLSMIILPCTLPLVFIVVPLSMGKGAKKGLSMAVLFGAGLTITIALYGFGIGALGQTADLDRISVFMFLIAGIAAFLFGLSQLKLFELKLPTYSGTPKFIQKRGDYSKSFFMGLLLGNAGVGCPNPMFYWLLIYIAGTGNMEIGASLGAVHGVGRAIPLILLSVLAIIGVNATKGITTNKITIEKLTGWMLIVLGAFLIINGIPGGHEWYETTFVHIAWNNFVSTTSLPPEFHIGQHTHHYDVQMPQEYAPILFGALLAFPIVWYFTRNRAITT